MTHTFKEKIDHDDGFLPSDYSDEYVSMHLCDWNDNDRACIIKISTLKWLMQEFGKKQKEFANRLWDCCRDWCGQPRAQTLDEVELFYEWPRPNDCGSYEEIVEAMEESWPEIKPEKPTIIYTTYKSHQEERWQ